MFSLDIGPESIEWLSTILENSNGLSGVAVGGYQSPSVDSGLVNSTNMNYSNSLSMMNLDELPGNMIGKMIWF